MANNIRELEQELNELQNNDMNKQSLAFLMSQRFKKIKSAKSNNIISDPNTIKAREICNKL